MALKEFELTDAQLAALYKAPEGEPDYYIKDGRRYPMPNMSAWGKLADELGFYVLTAVPCPGKSDKFFLAEPKPKSLVVEEEKKDEPA